MFAAVLCALLLSVQTGAAQELPTPQASASPLPSPSASAGPTESPSATPSPTPSPTPAPLVANPANVATNVGLAQTIAVTGATGPLSATLDSKIASVSVSSSSVTLGPIRNGTATLHIADTVSGAFVDVPVRIAPNAGTIAQQISLKITGDNPDPSFLSTQIALALNRATLALPGTSIQIASLGALPPLTPGTQASVFVPIKIAGGDQYLDVNGTTQINLQGIDAPAFVPTLLFYSDDPERVVSDGVLYRGTISDATPVRLYDYHENGPQPRRLMIVLTSASTATSSVQVVERFAGPNADVMTVGHSVTRDFMINKSRNQGVVVDIAGNAPLFGHDVLMNARDGVASSTDFKVLSGGPVTVTVLAVSPGVNPASLLDGAILPGDGRNRHGVFSLANYGSQSFAYAVGGPEVTVNVGDREPTVPNATPNDTGRDYGDYGVLYDLTFALTNPTSQPQTVYLFEAPRGGPARASYLIDTDVQPVELGCATSARSATDPPHRYLIRAFQLAPGANETHTVRTMTDGGSNLPITVGVTTVAPQPTTPPISASDGCFPKPGLAF